MLHFPVKIYPFEIFTRAMPGSSLVLNKKKPVFLPMVHCRLLLVHRIHHGANWGAILVSRAASAGAENVASPTSGTASF